MDRKILNDRLINLIKEFSARAVENRQVSRRLKALLPERLKTIERRHRATRAAGEALRLALADPEYQEVVEELSALTRAALEARIQYETHMMLFNARQSLRLLYR